MAPVVPWLVRGLALLTLILGGNEAIKLVTAWFDMTLMPHTEDMLNRAIIFGVVSYIVLLAVPFVPGAEIGLTLLTVLGGAIAPLIYLATATSLMLAFLIGRFMPPTVLYRALMAVGLHRAAKFVDDAAHMDDASLNALLQVERGPKALSVLLRHRYVALALAINTPGSILLGGGGGIALMAGLCRMFAPVPFALTVLVAVAPVPLLFYIGAL